MKDKKQDYRKTHVVIRELMADIGYTGEELGKALKLGRTAVSQRLNGRKPWKRDEMYKILDVFRVPEEHLHIVFPKNVCSKKRLPTKVA